jgi:hypothetical protein
MPIPKYKTDPGFTPLFKNIICCMCFVDLEEDTLYIDPDGTKWDVCKSCKEHEDKIMESRK